MVLSEARVSVGRPIGGYANHCALKEREAWSSKARQTDDKPGKTGNIIKLEKDI